MKQTSEQRRTAMLFVGVDWGEAHHDLCLLDQDGSVMAVRRIADRLAGVGELHALVAAHADDPAQVVVGIETDRGLLVGALLTAGYQVYAVNPQVVGRYRGRHQVSRAKSDRADAKVLADLVRTDRHNHRQVAGDSSLVEAVKVLARAHQNLIWTRQRHANALRSALREFYPGALAALGAQLAEPEALAVLELAPTPEQGRQLTRVAVRRVLVDAGRRRNLQARVVAVHDALAAPQLAAPEPVEAAYREVVGALTAVLRCLNEQVAALEGQLAARFGTHPDAAIVRSQPGLGVVLGARVLAEFGDDPHRYATAKGRKAFAGTAPVTRSSGLRTTVVARAACNQRLVDACYLWAFAALTASPGAQRCYDTHRARGATHHQALRALGNRLVGILHGCLAHRVAYQEQIAWPAAEAAT
jgi:transposase